MKFPIIMTEEYWANSQFSVVRHTGSIKINGNIYTIVNENGITIFELSAPGSPHYVKDQMAIPPGKPCDLVHNMWIPIYKKLGRDKFIKMVKENPDITLQDAMKFTN